MSTQVRTRLQANEDDLKSKIIKSMEEEGYCIVENFLSKERTAAMKVEVTAALDKVKYGRTDFEGCFDDLAIHPVVLGVMEHFLGDDLLLSSPTGIEIGPGEKEQLMHRDDGKYRLPLPHNPLIVNSMWALDDFTGDNGSTIYVPKSHKFNMEQQLEVFRKNRAGTLKEKTYCQMPAGSVLFYHGSLLHGGGANTTENTRLGTILEYCSGWVRPQENHILAIPKWKMKTLPERLVELLGFSVAQPFIGYVNGYHPKRWLHDDPDFYSKL